MGTFTFLVLIAASFNAGLPMLFGGRGFGFGGIGGGGGGRFGFLLAPPGPVFLRPVNASTRWADILEDTVQQALDHCKTVRLCNATGWATRYDSDCSECHPCACDDACYQRGDCCVDKLLRDASDRLVLDSAPLDDPVVGCHSTYLSDYRLASHAFMVDRCLGGGFPDAEVVDKCLLVASPNETDSRWPVWSPASDTVYRNAHCALCNGEDVASLVRWHLRIECDRSVHLADTSNEGAVMAEALAAAPSCQASFVPPEGCGPSPCRPSRGRYVDTCNATGRRFSARDEALWKACEVFHGAMSLPGATYRNVFCAMCNEEKVEALGRCPEERVFPFSVVLNASRFQQQRAAGGAAAATGRCRCPDGEVYDKYERKCRRLHCSMTRTLRNRQCEPLLTNSTGLFYDVAISLTPSDPHKPVYLRDKSSLKQVARNIRTAFLLQGSTASGWDVQIDHFRVNARTQRVDGHLNGNDGEEQGVLQVTCFKVHVKFGSLWPEPAGTLEARLFALMHSLWNVSVDGKPKRGFRAAPLHVKTEKKENETEIYPSVSLYSSDGRTVEYAVDIPDHQIQSYDDAPLATNFYLTVSEALKCAKVSFNASNETEAADFPLRVNASSGVAHHIPSNKFITFEFVELRDDGVALVCAEQLYDSLDGLVVEPRVPQRDNPFSAHLGEVSVVCLTASMACLFLVFFTYCLFPELRAPPSGKTTAGLVLSLLLALVLLELGVLAVELPAACAAVGVLAHFLLLSAFAWSALSCLRTYLALRRAIGSSPDGYESNGVGTTAFARCAAAAVALPAAVVAVTLLGNLLASRGDCALDLGYGNGTCFLSNRWSLLLAAVLPISVVVLLAILLYLLAARALAAKSRERKKASRQHHLAFFANVRVTSLMGLAWLTGMTAVLEDLKILRYVFVVLCCLLGAYVFAEFVCSKRVLKLCRGRFFPCCERERIRHKKDQKFTPVDT